MLRHSLILYRDDLPGVSPLPRFDGDGWLAYIPIRLPEAITVQKKLPPGAAALLINQGHGDPDLFLPVNANEKRLVDAIDGKRSIAEIIHQSSQSGAASQRQNRGQAGSLFERLYWFDQVVFQLSHTAPKVAAR